MAVRQSIPIRAFLFRRAVLLSCFAFLVAVPIRAKVISCLAIYALPIVALGISRAVIRRLGCVARDETEISAIEL